MRGLENIFKPAFNIITYQFSSDNILIFEYIKLIAQVVTGVQMETQYTYTLSWLYMM